MSAGKKIFTGLMLGASAGFIDAVPMIVMDMTWDAVVSAFSLWAASGVLISTSSLTLPPALKGMVISFLVLTPCAILIGWKNPPDLLPIAVMTAVLGSLLGFFIDRIK